MSCKMRADEVELMPTATEVIDSLSEEVIDSLSEEESETSHQHTKPNLPMMAA